MNTSIAEAAAYVAELNALGIRLRPLPDGRIYVQPAGLVDAAMADRIRAMRGPLREILSAPAGWACVRCGRFTFVAPTVCFWCRRAEQVPRHA